MQVRTFTTLLSVVFAAALCTLSVTARALTVEPNNAASTNRDWSVVEGTETAKTIFVVTVDDLSQRHRCRVKSIRLDGLECVRAVGGSRVYLPQEVAALILPGDGHLKLALVLGLNSVLGAAVWGTVVLAAGCPPCAVLTGVVAFALFAAAGAVLMGDDQPDRLLYLAPGQRLSGKLRHLQP